MAAAILTVGLLEISQVTDYALIIETKIHPSYQTNKIKGNFYLSLIRIRLLKYFKR